MSTYDEGLRHDDQRDRATADGARRRSAPGKATLTSRLGPSLQSIARAVAAELGGGASGPAVQARADVAARGVSAPEVHAAAAAGVAGAGGPLPFLDQIQRAFGHHDVSGVRAHVGGAAAEASAAIGARAYATGDEVAFAATPDLHLAAHEAAHVVQQRGGVRLAGGVGQLGDAYERHADAVADAVVRGESAQELLGTMAHRGAAGGPAVQRDPPRGGDGATATTPDAQPGSPGTSGATGAGPAATTTPTEWFVDYDRVYLGQSRPATPRSSSSVLHVRAMTITPTDASVAPGRFAGWDLTDAGPVRAGTYAHPREGDGVVAMTYSFHRQGGRRSVQVVLEGSSGPAARQAIRAAGQQAGVLRHIQQQIENPDELVDDADVTAMLPPPVAAAGVTARLSAPALAAGLPEQHVGHARYPAPGASARRYTVYAEIPTTQAAVTLADRRLGRSGREREDTQTQGTTTEQQQGSTTTDTQTTTDQHHQRYSTQVTREREQLIERVLEAGVEAGVEGSGEVRGGGSLTGQLPLGPLLAAAVPELALLLAGLEATVSGTVEAGLTLGLRGHLNGSLTQTQRDQLRTALRTVVESGFERIWTTTLESTVSHSQQGTEGTSGQLGARDTSSASGEHERARGVATQREDTSGLGRIRVE